MTCDKYSIALALLVISPSLMYSPRDLTTSINVICPFSSAWEVSKARASLGLAPYLGMWSAQYCVLSPYSC